MEELSPELKEKLDYEQREIIESNEKYILVSAGPGSGKTYTLIKKIKKDLERIDADYGIIACSFTKEASKQLEQKLKATTDIKSSYIGTIDSFILNEIINPFKNRYLKTQGENKRIDKLIIEMPEMKSESSYLTREGRNQFTSQKISNYINRWKQNFSKSIYEISFPSYIVAEEMIQKMRLVQEYLNTRYKCFYVDEAQDLNEFQIEFVHCLKNYCDMDIILIGDKNQSIYKFRGARPEKFYGFLKEGFVEYIIDVSVRCHKSILDFANRFIDNKYMIENKNKEIKVELCEFPKIEYFSSKSDFMILFEDNESAKNCYEYLSRNKIEVILTRQVFIDDKDFKNNFFDYFEETLKFFYNFDNGKNTYSQDDFINYLCNFIDEKKLKNLKDLSSFENPVKYFIYLLSLSGDTLSKEIVDNLEKEILDEQVIYYYKKSDKKNRIMTIHASKGLESELVIVRLSNKYADLNDMEYKRKLYVAFTRAKKDLKVCLKDCYKVKEELERIYNTL